MKIKFNESILKQVDAAIKQYGAGEIKEIQLTRDEYIQFLEEVDPTYRILLGIPGRMYNDVHIAIVP